MGRRSDKAKTGFLAAGILLFLFVAWALFFPHPARTLSRGELLRDGGIVLIPLSVTEQGSIGWTSSRPGISFYIVRLRVENRSDKPYRYEMHQVLARAVDGDRFVRSGSGQAALGNQGDPSEVLPYQSVNRAIAFESTIGAHQVAILFSLEGGPGVFLRGLFGTSVQVVCRVNPSGLRARGDRQVGHWGR